MRTWLFSIALVSFVSCQDGSAAQDPADLVAAPPADAATPQDLAMPARDLVEPMVRTEVKLFDRTAVYFTGMDNRRNVRTSVTFPPGPFRRVTLKLTLGCPGGACDPWDRLASLSVRVPVGDKEQNLEFARFVTPYRVGGTWEQELTDLQLLFEGQRTVEGFIDTWVGPGSPYGNGWELSATLVFEGGRPARMPLALAPLGWERAVFGDPARAIADQLKPAEVRVPMGTVSTAVYVLATGHGQGNRDNCAEFCSKRHRVLVDGKEYSRVLWRDDCDKNPINNQQGTWRFPRAGWCPGDLVRPAVTDLGGALGAGMHRIGYDVETYENSCRPGVAMCQGCTLGTSCDYDGGSHTEPFYQVTGYLIAFGS